MAGISQANIRLVSSHAGVEIGQDGPSQMALDDRPRLAHCAVRALPGSGTPTELMDAAGISANHIVAAALKLVRRSKRPRAKA